MACCALSTAVLAGAGIGMVIWNLARQDRWHEFYPGVFILAGMNWWLFGTIFGAIAGAPFVPVATWIGARLRIESMLYYLASGALSACGLVFLLAGPPQESPFGTTMAAWHLIPPSGALFGISWWYVHRRWQSAQPPTASGPT